MPPVQNRAQEFAEKRQQFRPASAGIDPESILVDHQKRQERSAPNPPGIQPIGKSIDFFFLFFFFVNSLDFNDFLLQVRMKRVGLRNRTDESGTDEADLGTEQRIQRRLGVAPPPRTTSSSIRKDKKRGWMAEEKVEEEQEEEDEEEEEEDEEDSDYLRKRMKKNKSKRRKRKAVHHSKVISWTVFLSFLIICT